MHNERAAFLARVNLARYHGQPQGFYESFFQRANHPTRPIAFWIRYTLFSPRSRPQDAIGELWFILFNGDTDQHLAVKQEFPFSQCVFSASEFHAQIGNAQLDSHRLQGTIQTLDHTVSWELSFSGEADPLLLLPLGSYQRSFPAAKSLVGLPLARYNGKLSLDGETLEIADWIGSQNHNWGPRHTDRYAWGQVAGFDTHPGSFLEIATAKLRIGPIWTPPFTPVVLRHRDKEYALNGTLQSIRAHGSFDYFTWNFKSTSSQVDLQGTLSAPRNVFVGLKYNNPPGGAKQCLNTKIASCVVQFRDRERGTTETLETKNRAAFEILTDDHSHGIPIQIS